MIANGNRVKFKTYDGKELTAVASAVIAVSKSNPWPGPMPCFVENGVMTYPNTCIQIGSQLHYLMDPYSEVLKALDWQ